MLIIVCRLWANIDLLVQDKEGAYWFLMVTEKNITFT